jgi:ribosomal protein S18 acetylase RimI-like enzyme
MGDPGILPGMDIRPIQEDDFPAVRDVARASLAASYDMVDEAAIDALVEELYARETLADDRDRETAVTLVAQKTGDVVGFAQAEVVDDGTEGSIRWLHVHPDARGEGVGSRLFRHTREALLERGIEQLSASVLADYEEGTAFYESRGFEPRAERSIEIGDQSRVEVEYVAGELASRGLQRIETPDGTLWVDREEDELGSEAPFYPVYTDDGESKWGWYCSACESTDTAMDTMGRIVCNGCENRRRPSRWDAAYM